MIDSAEPFFINKSSFSQMVEETVISKQLSYMDSIIYLCEKNNIELEDSRKYISNIIKGKLEVEAMDLNYLPKANELPFE